MSSFLSNIKPSVDNFNKLIDFASETNDYYIGIACEIWKVVHIKGGKETKSNIVLKKYVDIKPYYKYEIDFSVLNEEEKMCVEDISAMGKFKSALVSGAKIVGKTAKAILYGNKYLSDNSIIGLQIDKSSKFGTKIELSFFDENRLLYRTVKTNDIIFLWVLVLPRALVSSLKEYGNVNYKNFYTYGPYYESDVFNVKISDILGLDTTKELTFHDVFGKKDYYDKLIFYGRYYTGTKIKVERFNRELVNEINSNYGYGPQFAGFITVKNFHFAKTSQFRVSAMDMARMMQHLKVEYGFDGDGDVDKSNAESSRSIKNYHDNYFWDYCNDAFKYLSGFAGKDLTIFDVKGTKTIAEKEIITLKDGNTITQYKVRVEPFFRALTQIAYNRSMNNLSDPLNLMHSINVMVMGFDVNLRNLIYKAEKTQPYFLVRYNKTEDKYYLVLGSSKDDTNMCNYALATVLTQTSSKYLAFTSERFNPDYIDMFVNPFVETKRNLPSIVDIISLWINTYLNITNTITGNVKHNIWVSTNMFINDCISYEGQQGVIIPVLFSYSGRDWYSGKIYPTGKTHEMYLDEISEIDIFEVNRKGSVVKVNAVSDYIHNFSNVPSATCVLNIKALTFEGYNDNKLDEKDVIVRGFTDRLFDVNEISGSYKFKFSEYMSELKEKIYDLYDAVFDRYETDEENQDKLTKFDKLQIMLKKAGGNLGDIDINITYNDENIANVFGGSYYKTMWWNISINNKDKSEKFRLYKVSDIEERKNKLKTFVANAKTFINNIDLSVFNTFINNILNIVTEDDVYDFTSEKEYLLGNLCLIANANMFAYDLFSTDSNLFKDFVFEILDNYSDYFTAKKDARNLISEILVHDYSYYEILFETKFKNRYTKNVFLGLIYTLKIYVIKMIISTIDLVLKSLMLMINNLVISDGRTGSIYMQARPYIQVGDELILIEEPKGGLMDHISRKLRFNKEYGVNDVVYKNRLSRILGEFVKDKFSISKMFSKHKKYKKDLINNGEGKIFLEDGIHVHELGKDEKELIPKNKIPRWFVYRHIMYIGNFGVTSGFMSKIYITDNPLNSNLLFDEDNIVTRELSTLLQRLGINSDTPMSFRRMLG